MSLTISDTILDEEIRTPSTGTDDEHDTDATAALLAAIDAVTDAADFGSSPTGFPQFAESVDFVSSTNDPAVSNYSLSMNADGDPFPTSGAGVASGLYVGTTEIFLYGTADDNIVIGRLGGETGDIALVLVIEETEDGDGFVTQADMWTGIYYPLTHGGEEAFDLDDQLDLDDLVFLTSEFDTTDEVPFDNFAKVPSGQDQFALVGPTSGSSDVDLLITAYKVSGGSTVIDTVNVSTQGLGTGNQAVGRNESLRVDIVDANSTDLAKADTPTEVHNAGNISYTDGHQEAVGAKFEIEQINSNTSMATVTVYAYDTSDNTLANVQGSAFPQDAIDNPGDEVNITGVQILTLNADGITFTDVTADFLLRGGTIDLDSGNQAIVEGLLVHEWVSFTTAVDDPFTRFTATNTNDTKGSHTWDMGSIRVTVLQGGEDSETQELGNQLLFQDDSPLIERNSETAPTLVVDDDDYDTDDSDDFSGLFDEDYGADADGSVTYTLEINGGDGTLSGLTETSSGHAVYLFLESGEIVGREGTSELDAATGDEVFRIGVDGDGNVKLDQSSAVVHDDPDDPNESRALAADLIRLVATIDDGEPDASDDTDSDSADIGDSFVFYDDGPDIEDDSGDTLFVDNTVPGDSDSGDFTIDVGNDLDGNMTIIGAPDSGLFSFDYDNTDHDSITGYYDEEELYTLVLNDDGTYTFTLTGDIPSVEDPLDVNEIKAGGPDTNFIDVGTTNSDDYVKLSGFDASGNPAPINESNANVGVKNGNLDNSESITFTLWDENGAVDTQLYFLGLNIGTKSAKASDYLVSIDFVDPNTTDIVEQSYHVDKNGILEINPDMGLIQSITIEKMTGPALKLGLGDITILRPPGDFELTFDVQLDDGDDDYDTDSFVVQIDGDGDTFIDTPTMV